MICPECGHRTRTLYTRVVNNGNVTRRRRICDGCGRRYTTYEVWKDTPFGQDISRCMK